METYLQKTSLCSSTEGSTIIFASVGDKESDAAVKGPPQPKPCFTDGMYQRDQLYCADRAYSLWIYFGKFANDCRFQPLLSTKCTLLICIWYHQEFLSESAVCNYLCTAVDLDLSLLTSYWKCVSHLLWNQFLGLWRRKKASLWRTQTLVHLWCDWR